MLAQQKTRINLGQVSETGCVSSFLLSFYAKCPCTLCNLY